MKEGSAAEHQGSHEASYQVHFDFLVICGPSGVGKTTAAHAISERYGLSPPLKVGDLLRNRRSQRAGEDVLGPVDKSVLLDAALDRLQAWHMRRAFRLGHTPLIVEGRRAALIAQLEQERARQAHQPVPRFVKVFLSTAEPMIRMRRIQRRQSQYSLEEVTEMTQSREQHDLSNWKAADEIYPGQLYAVNPFDPAATPYDLVLLTDSLSAKETVEAIDRYLFENHWITRHPPAATEPPMP